MATKTEPLNLGDLLVWEADPLFSRESVSFSNASGGTLTYEVGLALEVSGANMIPVATAGNAVALLAERIVDMPTGTTKKVCVLVRNAVVHDANIGVNGLVAATVKAALKAKGLITMLPPTISTTNAA